MSENAALIRFAASDRGDTVAVEIAASADVSGVGRSSFITRESAKLAGRSRFFTGEPCVHGHVDERMVSNTACLTCHRNSGSRWRSSNPETVRNSKKRWALANSDAVKIKRDIWRRNNSEKLRLLRISRYVANKKKYIARVAAWLAADPMRVRIKQARRRAKMRNAGGKFTRAEISLLLVKQKHRCANPICKKSLKSGFHADHIMPLALGGAGGIRNIQLLCPPCNLAKRAKHPVVWAQSLGLLV